MKKILVVIPALITVISILAQEGKQGSDEEEYKFVFQYVPENFEDLNVNPSMVGSHFLGREMAIKEEKLEKLYTYTVEGSPTSPGTKTVVSKPEIYYSLKKVKRYLKRAVRKENISKELATRQYSRFLDIAISVINQETNDFEEYLGQYRRKEQNYEAFQAVKLVE